MSAPGIVELPGAGNPVPPTPGGVASGAPPGGPPGAHPFHRALEGELARTALAEGQKKEAGGEPQRRHSDRVRGGEDEAGQNAAATATAQTQRASAPEPAAAQGATEAPAATDGSAAPDGAPLAAVPTAAPALEASSAAPPPALPAAESSQPGPASTAAGAASPAQTPVNAPGAPVTTVAASSLPPSTPAASAPAAESEGGTPGAEGPLGGPRPDAASGSPARESVPIVPPGEPHDEGPTGATPQAGADSPGAVQATADAADAAAAPGGAPAGEAAVAGPARAEAPGPSSAVRSRTGGGRSTRAARSDEVRAERFDRSGSGSPRGDAHPVGAAAGGRRMGAAAPADAVSAEAQRSAAATRATGLTAGEPVPAAPQGQPLGAAASTAAQAPQTAVPELAAGAEGAGMQETIEAIHATIGLAVRRGISQARIALQPAELGEIRVHLSQSADGLIARLTADTPAAAQILSAGRAELHHSLSTLGTSLLRLEIGSSGNPEGRQEREAAAAGQAPRRRETTGSDASIESDETPETPAQGVAGGMRGELVDVLA